MALEQIDQIEQRVRSYWYDDGLAELATGGVFLLLGLYFGLQGYLGDDSGVGVILQVTMALFIILGVYFVRRIVNSLKIRLTYPRTGYVEYHVDARALRLRRFATAAVGFAVGILLIYLYRSVRGLDMVVLASGVLVAFIFAALRIKARGMKRFYFHGCLSLAIGIALSISGLPQAFCLALFYGLLGIALMLSGGFVLHRYLIANPSHVEAKRAD